VSALLAVFGIIGAVLLIVAVAIVVAIGIAKMGEVLSAWRDGE
jgi:hypothetical protein